LSILKGGGEGLEDAPFYSSVRPARWLCALFFEAYRTFFVVAAARGVWVALAVFIRSILAADDGQRRLLHGRLSLGMISFCRGETLKKLRTSG
jgi:hypothetical protein